MKNLILLLLTSSISLSLQAQWNDTGTSIETDDNVIIKGLRIVEDVTLSLERSWIHFKPGSDRQLGLLLTNDGRTKAEIKLWEGNTHNPYISFSTSPVSSSNIEERMRIDKYGNLGIGTPTPSYQVHLKKTSGTSELRAESSEHYAKLGASNAGGFLGASNSNGDLTVNIRGYGDAFFNAGNVGIGTEEPSELLDVNGNVEFGLGTNALKIKQGDFVFEGVEKPYLFHDSGTNRKVGLGITDDGAVRNYIELFEGNNHNIQYIDFGIQGSSAMRINSQGEVGIGTTDFSNDHKLRVEGSIGAREIKVEATGWSDFVFDSEYELRTLETVEEHINENGHLPEIPSEAEVTKNGINLGEMNAKLLQKIEELTLYVIELNKQNQAQQKEIDLLKRRIED